MEYNLIGLPREQAWCFRVFKRSWDEGLPRITHFVAYCYIIRRVGTHAGDILYVIRGWLEAGSGATLSVPEAYTGVTPFYDRRAAPSKAAATSHMVSAETCDFRLPS